MPDWTKSMQQTHEYYLVDPNTWMDRNRLDTVKSATLSRDLGAETLGSASFDLDELLGEAYIRTYLITNQNGVVERFALGTYLVQTPSQKFNGISKTVTVDAYTPLLELKDNQPEIGFSLLKDEPIMERAYMLARSNMRAPVVRTNNTKKLVDNFIAESNDTWLSYTSDLISQVDYRYDIDPYGKILYAPAQQLDSMTPTYTFNDDNSSILYADVDIDHDLYGIPNVVEITYSSGGVFHYAKVKNENPNSPVSIPSRGREIVYRENNPSFGALPSQSMIEEYAEKILRNKSTLQYTITYTHGYCPVTIGDCVRLNYKAAGLNNIKAKIISQSISCVPGTPVSEQAIFTKNLWEG